MEGPAFFFDGLIQPDGKIVAAGHINWGTAIVRYNANGSLDSSFAGNGIFRTERSFNAGNSIALQPDGKLVGFGSVETANGRQFGVVRLNPNGSPDTRFGTNGRLMTLIGSGEYGEAFSGTVQPDGKILAFGRTVTAEGDHVAMLRYRASGYSISGRILTPGGIGQRGVSGLVSRLMPPLP